MKLLVAAILVAIAAAKLSSNELRDTISSPGDLQPYKSGYEYRYRYDSQIASGIAEISHQKSLTRIQAEAILYFNSERLVTLRLENILVGAAKSRMMEHADRLNPFSFVEKREIEPEHNKLALPLQFSYNDGLIEKISFDTKDATWSKNIKRSVLSLLQVNLKARNLDQNQKEEVKAQDPKWKSLTPRMFSAFETTIEGECDTTYVINKLENTRLGDADFFNVTKTIDFNQCKKLADVSYGPQLERRLVDQWQEDLQKSNDEEEQKLRRSTIVRHFVVGTPEKFSIKKVESVSQYEFKTINAESKNPMVSVVVNELTCIGFSETPSEQQPSPAETRDETLLYSNDFDRDVKRFYMYGDDEYNQETSPFAKLQNKKDLILTLIANIQRSSQDKKKGIESEATVNLMRLVELLRTCTVNEIEDIVSRNSDKSLELLYDALFLAATRNTIHVVTEKIIDKQISSQKAIQALTALSGSPAPSDKQIEILTKLCKSEPAKKSESLRQSCWLTVGKLIGELCETSQQNSYVINKKSTNELCPTHTTDKFIETFNNEYRKANNRYEKILILKAIGNAGLEESIKKLEQIINDEREDPLVRAQAIDSLRRLVGELPLKVQMILLPIFKNQAELTELRLHSLSLLLQTNPDNAILDQVASVLLKDRSKQVRSFAYTIVKSYAKSPIAKEQRLAQRLYSISKLAGIGENEQEKMSQRRSSYASHIPIYSKTQDEGVFYNLESVFESDNALPKKLSTGIDTFLNGIFEKNAFELNIQQQDIEQWLDNWSSSERSNRGSSDELSQIFSKLELKTRDKGTRGRQHTAPFGFLGLRMRNLDYAIFPLEQETMPEALRKIIVDGERPNFRNYEFLNYFNGATYQFNSIWNFYERMNKVPTASGIPLKLTLSIPALATVEGNGKLRSAGLYVKIQPSFVVSLVQKMEAWLPIVNSGVENVASVEYNVPWEFEVMYEGAENKIVFNFNIPQEESRMLGYHSLPATYIRNYDNKYKLHKDAEVQTIRNKRMEEYKRHFDNTYGQETMPFYVSGHIHEPVKYYSYKHIFDALVNTENHIHAEFKPNIDSPKQIQLKLNGEFFRPNTGRLRPTFTDNFYDKFNDQLAKHYDFQQIGETNDKQALGKVFERYESSKSYKSGIQAELKTIGGRTEKSANLKLEATCDDQYGFCKTLINLRRDPLNRADQEWKLEANIQAILPDSSVDYRQYESAKDMKNSKFLCSIDCNWQSGQNEQYANIKINGEQAMTNEWIKWEKTEAQRKGKSLDSIREKSAFLNKYDVSVEYKLDSDTRGTVSRGFDLFKLYNFFNTKVDTISVSKKSNGLITGLIVIDPISQQHCNLSINTPSEKVYIDTIPMPTKIAPFTLVRRTSSKQVSKSAKNFISSIIEKSGEKTEECLVDSTKVRTFDGVTFKAPITKCYTVLAKDCSSRNPRFAVLMRKADGEEKKLRVIHKNGPVIEIKKDHQGMFFVAADSKSIYRQEWEERGIYQLDNTVIIENRDLTVRFDGRQAWIKISELYKNKNCGVCGHYDDDEEHEFVKGDNEKTSDIRKFHESFTIKTDECKSDYDEAGRSSKFETVDSDEFEKGSNRREGDEDEPIEKTMVMEYNHKICFSMKPIKECPRDRYPTNESNNFKVQFACLGRDSLEARRLIRQLKSEKVLDEVRKLAPSFVENIKFPTKCVEL